MTRRFIAIVFGVLIVILSGCSTDDPVVDADQKLIEMDTILTLGGYNMELVGPAKTFSFNTDDINEKFDIEVSVFQLYVCEQDNEEDVYMIVFWEEEEAITYENAYMEQPELEDRYFLREGPIVIVTYSEDAYDLFQ